MPSSDQKTRKAPSLRMLPSISAPSNCLLTASVESSTISTTPTRSSTTRMPSTTPVKRCPRNPMSSKALKTIAVDDIESIPPRKMLLMCEKPSDMPVPYPTNIIPATIVTAAVTAVPPTLSSLRNENSSPMAKSRKMTPMSAHTRMLDASETVGMNDTEGPASTPATM